MNLAQISISVIFLSAITVLTGEELHNFVPNDFRPTFAPYLTPIHYKINLTSYYVRKTIQVFIAALEDPEIFDDIYFNGTTHIMINILYPTKSIKLHTQAIYINHSSIQLIETNVIISPKETLYDTEENILNINFIDVIFPGIYTLKISTISRISNYDIESKATWFFKNIDYRGQNPLSMTVIVPHIQDTTGARKLFPCWDEPHLKASFSICIRHISLFGTNVLSNMGISHEIREFQNEDIEQPYIHSTRFGETKWTHFHPTPPIATHQVAIVVTGIDRHDFREYKKKNMALFCSRCQFKGIAYLHRYLTCIKYNMQIISDIALHMESEFKGITFPKIDHIALRNCPYNITSKWGFIFYSERDIVYDNAPDRFMRKIEIERRIAYKIAQQWLGYSVSSSGWFNFWLHDGLTIFLAEDTLAKIYNDSHMVDLFTVQNQYDSLNLDSYYNLNLPVINELSDFESLLNFPRYIKVIVVLRMLQSIVTDKVFRRGVYTYLNQQISNSGNISDFWSIQENLAKESYPCDFISWLVYKHYPIISWKYKNRNVVKLEQYCSQYTSCYHKWSIPISIETKTSFPGKTKLWLTGQMYYTHFYHVPVNDLITLNTQQTGHYRIYYNSENWLNIANYLNSGKYKDINVINRARFIDDAFHMVLDHQLNGSVFWNLAKYLSQETDYVAWYPMIKAFEYVSTAFLLVTKDGKNFTHIKKNMSKLLDKPMEILGFEERPKENSLTKCLRQDVLRWACAVGNSKCLSIAFNKLQQYLKNSTSVNLPGWKEWIFCRGFMAVDNTNPLRNMSVTWKDNVLKYTAYQPCFEDMQMVRKLFFRIYYDFVHSEKNRSKEEIIHWLKIYSYILKFTWNEEILYILLKRHSGIPGIVKPREISETIALIMIINNVHVAKGIDMIGKSIMEKPTKEIRKIESKIQHKIKTRKSEINRHIDHFRTFLN